MNETKEESQDEQGNTVITISHFVYNTALNSDPGDPKDWREAAYGRDGDKWIPSMIAEHRNFIKRKGWLKVLRADVAKRGRKAIKTKWVFKAKSEQDGSTRYRSRAVTCGYMQVPGVDYTESFSPVANDTIIRTVIGIVLYYDEQSWIIEVVDVEAAFLEAEIDQEVFIEWPPGSVELGLCTESEYETYCIMLGRSMYGNVDAALRWSKTLESHLVNVMMMKQSLVDPCLYFWKDTEGQLILVVVIHVDDIALGGKKKTIEKFKAGLRERFGITELGVLKKHLGVWYEWGRDKNGPYVKASMPEMAKAIVLDFEKHIGREVKGTRTPGYPGTSLIKGDAKEEPVHMEMYRSLVGKIMYYTTKIGPDIANAARELSGFMQSPNSSHWRAMERMVGYLKTKSEHAIIMRKPRELRPIGHADSNYATNSDDRKSISGHVHTVGGCITNWMSKKQATVTLSSTEAEYVSASTHCIETKFTQMLLDELTGSVRPAVLYEDNTGCIFLIKNQQVGPRTKHIDVRHHHVRGEMRLGNFVPVVERSEDNPSDIMTKNVSEAIHERHAGDILNGTMKCWREDVKIDVRVNSDSPEIESSTLALPGPEVGDSRKWDPKGT